MKTQTCLSSLYQALVDEQFFPEILIFDWNLINFFKEILIYQYQIIKQDSDFSSTNQISKSVKELEIFRITGIFKSYHRNRLWKIENFISQKSKLFRIVPRLSKSEEYFTISFRNLLFSHKSLMHDDFEIKNFDHCFFLDYPNNQIEKLMHRENYIFFRLLDVYEI